jgi:hypothetical protein
MAAVPGPSIWAMLLIGFESEVGTNRTNRAGLMMSVYCEEAFGFLESCSMEDEGYFAALIRMLAKGE